MGKTVKLLAHHDRYNTGETGLVTAGMNIQEDMFMTAMEGRLIAHDILEHVNGVEKIGSCADELEAIGSIWFIRGQYGQIKGKNKYSNRSPNEILGDDLSQICLDYLEREFTKSGVKIEKIHTKTHYYDADFEDIISRGCERALNEIEYFHDTPEETKEKQELTKEFFDSALGYLRTGYRKAERKYKGKDVLGLFWTITETLDKFLSGNEIFDGMEFTLHYGFDKFKEPYARMIDKTEYGY